MQTNPALTTQKFASPLLRSDSSARTSEVTLPTKAASRTRFAAIAGLAFALTLPALGIVDPKVLMTLSLSQGNHAGALLARAEQFLGTLDVAGQLVTGGAAVIALAAMSVAGYVRTRLVNERKQRSE